MFAPCTRKKSPIRRISQDIVLQFYPKSPRIKLYELKEAKRLAEFELNTALLTNMEVLECLSRRGGTAVYSVKSTRSEQLYILKHISVPESQKQVEALIFSGAAADNAAAQEYYQQVVADYQAELELMETLSNSPNLDCFRSYEIRPKEDGVGFDVFLLAEQRTTLEQYLLQTPMTQSSAVNLAMDLCNALSDLRAAGLIHRDVKPANIYLSPQGHFMLGDIGLAKVEDLKYCSMPESMLSSYSAPELFELMANVNETIDLYAVGLILYRIYNGNHAPLEDEKTSAKAADKLRVTGQALPAPMFADYEMAGIISKACAFKPEDRYQSPDELKEALVDYMKRNQVGDAPIMPPIVADDVSVDEEAAQEAVEPVQFANTEEMDDAFKESFSPDNDMLNALIESVHKDIDQDYSSSRSLEPQEDDLPLDSGADKPRKRKKITKWLPTVLAVVLVLALAGAAVWFFFIRTGTLTIDAMEATERTTNSITVSIETQEAKDSFEVVCTDAYGNVTRQPYTGEPNVFTDLAAGTQYTISVEGLKRESIAGVSSISTSTKSTTNIVSFTVNRITASEMDLSFVVDGTEPEEWTVSYGPTGGQVESRVFTGHTVTLTGLEPDTDYTVTLTDPADLQLTGATSATGHTIPSVSITDIRAQFIGNNTATLTWEFTGDAPESWTLTTTGTDGYSDAQTVTENTATLENLKAGETYTILITSDSMVRAVSTTIAPNDLTITELTAKPNETGGLDVAWMCEASSEDTQWLVVYTLEGQESAVEQVTDTSVTLSGLIPAGKYTITIEEASGKPVGGETTTEVTLPEAEEFHDYGFGTAYVSTWLKPNKENWTSRDLATIRTSFSAGETLAFACQSNSTVQSSDDTVTALLVVRDSDGNVVDYYSGQETWSNMWSNKLYVGELTRMPETAGDYTLEIYFNGKLVDTGNPITFKVTG